MLPVDQIRDAAVGYLEGHAVDIGRFLIRSLALWIKDRRHAEAVIERAHADYEKQIATIRDHMRGGE